MFLKVLLKIETTFKHSMCQLIILLLKTKRKQKRKALFKINLKLKEYNNNIPYNFKPR